MIKFLFAWWETPLYLWSFKVLAGLICLLVIILIPFAIIKTIYEMLEGEE